MAAVPLWPQVALAMGACPRLGPSYERLWLAEAWNHVHSQQTNSGWTQQLHLSGVAAGSTRH